MKTLRWLPFSALALLLVGCSPSVQSMAPAAKAEPKVTLDLVDWATIQQRIQSHQGKIVVVDCWSTSCEPCLREFPGLVTLSHKHPDQVACISLSFDFEGLGKPEEQRDKVLSFLQSKKATLENLLSTDPCDDLYAKLKLAAIPAVFVYDRHGKLAQKFDDSYGGNKGFTYADVDAEVTKLMSPLGQPMVPSK